MGVIFFWNDKDFSFFLNCQLVSFLCEISPDPACKMLPSFSKNSFIKKNSVSVISPHYPIKKKKKKKGLHYLWMKQNLQTIAYWLIEQS